MRSSTIVLYKGKGITQVAEGNESIRNQTISVLTNQKQDEPLSTIVLNLGGCLIMNNYWHSYNSNCGFMTTAAFGDYQSAQANTLKKIHRRN